MNVGILKEKKVICRFNLQGRCRFGDRCWNIHESAENLTEWLEEKNKEVSSECATSIGACSLSPRETTELRELEYNKENIYGPSTSSDDEAIALVKRAESNDKMCGICFDTILQKVKKAEQTFGILPNCNHCFCFTCIKKWRQSKEFELDVAKACPECRVASDFVYPSKFWVDNKDEKQEFIDTQKRRMGKLGCKYFRKGKGTCPFGNTCLYLHALSNGKTVDVGPPLPRRRRMSGIDNELVHQILFLMNDFEDDDDDDSFDLDLEDPYIAMQYYDHDDIRRYIAMDSLFRESDDDSDYDFCFP